MLYTVSFRFTLCISRQRDCTGPWIVGMATSVTFSVVTTSASLAEGMRITCPMRKFSALSPGLAETVKVVIPTKDRVGKNKVIFKVANEGKAYRKTKDIEVHKGPVFPGDTFAMSAAS